MALRGASGVHGFAKGLLGFARGVGLAMFCEGGGVSFARLYAGASGLRGFAKGVGLA